VCDWIIDRYVRIVVYML